MADKRLVVRLEAIGCMRVFPQDIFRHLLGSEIEEDMPRYGQNHPFGILCVEFASTDPRFDETHPST